MKKLLFAMIVMIGMLGSISFAEGIALDNIVGVISACGCENGIETMYASQNSGAKKSFDLKCDTCNEDKEVTISGLHYAYSKDMKFSDETITSSCECGTTEIKSDKKEYWLEEAVESLKYKEVLIEGKEWLVKPELHGGDMRLLYFSGIEADDPKLISFNKTKTDLFQRDNTGKTVTGGKTIKVRTGAIYTDVAFGDKKNSNVAMVDPDSGASHSAFFVCKEHIECDGKCKKNVAVATDDLYVSKYCEDEACPFVWIVENGNEDIASHEGLKCTETRGEDHYCSEHKCKNCKNPIIGTNQADGIQMIDSVVEFLAYQGANKGLYSGYCVDHTCRARHCYNNIPKADSVLPEPNEHDDIYYIQATNIFCERHANSCAICGKVQDGGIVTQSDYEAYMLRVCPDCLLEHFDDGELQEGKLKKCSSCENEFFFTYSDAEGNILCYSCAWNKAEVYIKNDQISNDSNDPETAFVRMLIKEFAQDHYELVKDNYTDEVLEDGGQNWYYLLKDGYENIYSDILNGIFEDMGIDIEENEVLQGLVSDRLGKVVCSKCGSIKVIDRANNVQYCPNKKCGENGDYDGGDKPGSDRSGGGSWGSESSGSTVWNSTLTGTTVDPATCQHNTYPVPIDATFTNITNSGHTQNWNCSNCKTAMTQTYNHTFINGVCVCGFKESDQTTTDNNSDNSSNPDNSDDTEAPKIVEVTPSTGELKGGETVKVKLTDDVELSEIIYICVWGDKKVISKYIEGNEVELELGTLPTEEGTYELYIQSVKDTAGNVTQQDTAYIFVVGKDGNYNAGQYVDDSFETEDDNSIIYEDDSSSPTPI